MSLITLLIAFPQNQEMASVYTDFHSWKNRDTFGSHYLLQTRVPIHSVVIGCRDNVYTAFFALGSQFFRKIGVRNATTPVSVIMLRIRRRMDLEIAEVVPRVCHRGIFRISTVAYPLDAARVQYSGNTASY